MCLSVCQKSSDWSSGWSMWLLRAERAQDDADDHIGGVNQLIMSSSLSPQQRTTRHEVECSCCFTVTVLWIWEGKLGDSVDVPQKSDANGTDGVMMSAVWCCCRLANNQLARMARLVSQFVGRFVCVSSYLQLDILVLIMMLMLTHGANVVVVV